MAAWTVPDSSGIIMINHSTFPPSCYKRPLHQFQCVKERVKKYNGCYSAVNINWEWAEFISSIKIKRKRQFMSHDAAFHGEVSF